MASITTIAENVLSVPAEQPAVAAASMDDDDNGGGGDNNETVSSSNASPAVDDAAAQKKANALKAHAAKVQAILRICRALTHEISYYKTENKHGFDKSATYRNAKIAKTLLQTYALDRITESIVSDTINRTRISKGRRTTILKSEDEQNFLRALFVNNPTHSRSKISGQFRLKFGQTPSERQIRAFLKNEGLDVVRKNARIEAAKRRKQDKTKKQYIRRRKHSDSESSDDGDDGDDSYRESISKQDSESDSVGADSDDADKDDGDDDDDATATPIAKKAKKTKSNDDSETQTSKVLAPQKLYDMMLGDARGFDHAAFDRRPTTYVKRDAEINRQKKKN